MLLRSCVLVVLLALGGCDAPSSEGADTRDEPETPVAVVKTAALEPAEIARKVEGVAAIINPDTLLQLDADLRSAVIASEFSKSQLNRAETLMKTSVAVSKQTYENAQRQSESDITHLHLLEFRLRQVWGDDAPFLTTESRRQLVGELSAGTRALVRIDFPDSYGSAPRNIRVAPLSGGAETPVETIWVAPAGNQSMPGVSYFGLIPAGPGLRHGDRARVVADAASERAGLIIPNSAIIVYASEAWCFVETEPQKFERRPVPLDYPVRRRLPRHRGLRGRHQDRRPRRLDASLARGRAGLPGRGRRRWRRKAEARKAVSVSRLLADRRARLFRARGTGRLGAPMNALIRWSIRYRGLVAALSVVWIVAGTILALRAPLDVFPEFVPPQVTIQTESAGLAPEQVEQIVTRPIEAAVNGAPGIASMRSESVYGLSVILVTFEEGVDAVDARQGISERLATLTGKLPIGVEQPKLTPLTSSTMDVIKIGLVSDTVDPFTLRDIADWTVKPRLLAVPGIARVSVYGGAIRQVQIQPKLDRLTALGLDRERRHEGGPRGAHAPRRRLHRDRRPADHARDAAARARPAGDRPDARHHAEQHADQARRRGDRHHRPGDSGRRGDDHGPPRRAAHGLRPVRLQHAGSDQGHGSGTRRDDAGPRGARHRGLSDAAPARDLRRARARQSRGRAALGSALILIVLYAFPAQRARGADLVPRHSAVAARRRRRALVDGPSLNTMTLGGFAVALGVLVDDAIIDIENIMRRLRQARRARRHRALSTSSRARRSRSAARCSTPRSRSSRVRAGAVCSAACRAASSARWR